MERFDAIVVGAGAAGMFCAAQAGQLGCRVLLLDNGKKPGRKILMSGGGRCNFTNMYVEPAAYLSQNPHFCKSALARYTQWDFIELVGKYGIAWHEKTLGQLFCDDSAEQIVNLLLAECEKGGVEIRLRSEILSVERDEQGYRLQVNGETLVTKKLVIASGGLSMPGLGASPFGYKVAEQFGLKVLPTRAGLVPFTPWRVQPNGTEGYRTAEVTLGGVDTNELSSRTMEARKAPGLYFIGEVMDVTGWLGGYNFQWAWSSAWACAQALVEG